MSAFELRIIGMAAMFSLLALLPILLYDRSPGPRIQRVQYCFYPVHLMGVAGIAGMVA